MNRHLFLPALLLLACAGSAFAQSTPAPPPALPEWDQLTPQQRETLIAPLRDRWNDSTDERARMYEHALRWQAMTPQQRELARRGMHRFEHMDPQQRRDAKVLFVKMRGMSAEQRETARRVQGHVAGTETPVDPAEHAQGHARGRPAARPAALNGPLRRDRMPRPGRRQGMASSSASGARA
jgi:hypothetical protein